MNTQPLIGNWDEGYVLDDFVLRREESISSAYGEHIIKRTLTDLGNHYKRFKRYQQYGEIDYIIHSIIGFISNWPAINTINTIVSVPESNNNRIFQPVKEISKQLAKDIGIPYSSDVLLKLNHSPVKGKPIEDRKRILENSIALNKYLKTRSNILLIDDVYMSGTTLNSCCNILRTDPYAGKIYVLCLLHSYH